MSKKSKIILLIGAIVLIIMTCTSYKKLENINGNSSSNLALSTGSVNISMTGLDDEHRLVISNEEFKVGQIYETNIGVLNSSEDAYTRALIYKYWTTLEGNKVTEVDPKLIEIGFEDNAWIEDIDARTSERTILYYPEILKSGEEIPLMDWIKVNNEVLSEASITSETNNGYTTYTMSYPNSDLILNIEIEVDAIQAANVEDSLSEIWGVDVIVNDDGSLSFP